MKNRWSDEEAASVLDRYGSRVGEDVALRLYTARLIGAEPDLVLHGGGNVSVKTTIVDVLGRTRRALLVKASGADLSTLEPEGLATLDLDALVELRGLEALPDEKMLAELNIRALRSPTPTPSLEALAHAFLPGKFVEHTHADAILGLTNQVDGERLVREALGEEVLILGYVRPGFRLAKAAADLSEVAPGRRGMIWARHGIVTWGETPRESYGAMIELVTRAEEFLERRAAAHRIHGRRSSSQEQNRDIEQSGASSRSASGEGVDGPASQGAGAAPGAARSASGKPSISELDASSLEAARSAGARIAPVLRGLLAVPTEDADRPHRTIVLTRLATQEVLAFLRSPEARAEAVTPPLTTDHLIRTKGLPLWVDLPEGGGPDGRGDDAPIREALVRAITAYTEAYHRYLGRHEERMPAGIPPSDPMPRVLLIPGVGAFCSGKDVEAAIIARDITEHTLLVKAKIAAGGRYEGLSEEHLFEMEYHVLQSLKLSAPPRSPLEGRVALVTGAAGAIGSGVCRTLLEAGCHVAATDVSEDALDSLEDELRSSFGERAIGVPLDVTDPASVAEGFGAVAREWGGVDLVVVNAGVAHVSTIAEMDLAAFQRLERVNVEGTLLVLGEAARMFERQGTGGDIVLISTKNVAAPGAGFGAYSATKAAAHQLARIASLEMAPLGVRVNMVAPDAVFSEGSRKSGLWAEVGPARMRSRGGDAKGLEEYYRARTLLKSPVTAAHVARAVLFFATRQTPTTGATLPVDGGLPDATPR